MEFSPQASGMYVVVSEKWCYSLRPLSQEAKMSVPTASTTVGPSAGSLTELVFVSGSEQRRVALDHVPFTIGRKPDKDLVITDTRVSRDHAVIQAEGADFVLTDVGSSSGTFVNGEKVQRRKLKYNDRVELGAKGGPYFVFNPTSSEQLELVQELSATARVSIFSKLNQADIEELTKIVSVKKYGPDAAIFFQGDPSDSLYMLLKGSVKVTQASEDGREKILDILGPGEIFGEFAMLDGHPRSATVTTCEPAELASISHKDFRNFVASRPEVLWKVLQALCERVRKTSTEMLELSSREVPYRLLAALQHLAEKYGQVAPDGSCLISGKVGVQDLVAMVGSSREVVSRLLHRYQEKGLIELGDNKQIIIPDPAALARALEYSSEWS
jgi:CRP/FNR family transcriptional regulator, cyclic AMP receptor protein